MTKATLKKKALLHLVAILVFLALACIYCSPVLQGNTVNQGDITQVEGMAHDSKVYYDKTHIKPLWTNSLFGGMPTYLIYSGPSANKIGFLNGITTLWLPSPINMLFIAMLGMYFLLSVVELKYAVSLFGAVGYGFSSYNVILITAGHVTKLMTMAWMAPVLAGVWLVYKRKYLLGGVVTALSSAVMIYNNHIQVIYYMLILLGFFVVYQLVRTIKTKEWPHFIKASLICLVAALLAALPASDNLLVTRAFTPYTIRGSQSELTLANKTNQNYDKGGLGIDYAFQWSLGKLETFSILVPNIYGGPPPSEDFVSNSATYQQLSKIGVPPQQAANFAAQSLYWGPQPFTTPVYFGALICFLFLLSFFLVKRKLKWWILGLTVLAFAMAWGNHFTALNDFLFYHLPLYNKFRAPTIILIIPQFTFVLMGAWGLNELAAGKIDQKEAWEAIKKTLYIMGGLVILLAVLPGSMLGYAGARDAGIAQQAGPELLRALHSDRASLLHKDALRSLILILLLFGLLWAYIRGKIKVVPFFVAIGVLLLFDLFGVDKRYLNENNFVPKEEYANIIQPTQADQALASDTSDYRVLNLSADIFNDAITSYFHHSIGGYNPAKLWRYQDLIDYQLVPEIQRIQTSFQGKKSLDSSVYALLESSPVLNMLDTKYYILAPSMPPIPNRAAAGNAWFVNEIRWVPNADSEMTALTHFDPRSTAIIDQRFKARLDDFHPAADSGASITLTSHSPNEMQYTAVNTTAGFGVFSEVYYPAGWLAYIDGKETPIIRVNYLLRGLKIPAGAHKIDFKFHPPLFYTAEKISGISSVALMLLVLAGLAWALLREIRREEPPVPEEVKTPEKPQARHKKR